MGDGGQNGAQGFDTHGDIEQMAGIEEIVEVAEKGHNRIPDQIQECLRKSATTIHFNIVCYILNRLKFVKVQTHVIGKHNAEFPDLVLDVDRCQPVGS